MRPSEFPCKQMGPFVLIQRPTQEHRARHLSPSPKTRSDEPCSEKRPRRSPGRARCPTARWGSCSSSTRWWSRRCSPLQGIDELSVGRLPDCDLVIEDASASKRHAVLRWDAEHSHATIQDLGSTNGTYINAGNRLDKETALHDGDIVSFGEVQFWYLLTATLHTKLMQAKNPSAHRGV